MSSIPALYNISLSDQSAFLRFFPQRDGPLNTMWNVTYSGSNYADWSTSNNFGIGTSSHNTTFIGAYLLVDWTGTGIWFDGTMEDGAYTVQIDDGSSTVGTGATNGVLFGQDGLPYGPHQANLTVIKNNTVASITGATITVGMGEPGTILEQRTINTTIEQFQITGNPFFSANGTGWSPEILYTDQQHSYPCIETNQVGSTVSFNLNESVGFALYGSDDYQQGLFTVNVTIPGQPTPSYLPNASTQRYSPKSQWTALNQLKFLATGMNRSETYNVVITNTGSTFNLASVVAYDAVPNATASSSSTSSKPTSSAGAVSTSRAQSHSVKGGVIAGATIGAVLAVAIVSALIFLATMRRRRHRANLEAALALPTSYPKPEEGYAPAPTQSPPTIPVPLSEKRSRHVFTLPTTLSVGETSASAHPSSSSQVPSASVNPPTIPGTRTYTAVDSDIHEVDAGPLTQPPVYDPAWAESSVALNS
ncbi:hypothetical protein WOLCODRAFT_140558 [Wolfiporia cocos MD-104 SS10]|uniref:Uncharacterized protein n=1 Tax=Wolfiporia cocos (strain MD-104) TaxID=742152 RepID=A0A2H3J3A1_WOLCO|nr:hypothetical protein WOLCODRAFT_140558 [Wolfiporia cocos MD-104 SS10]